MKLKDFLLKLELLRVHSLIEDKKFDIFEEEDEEEIV